MVKYTLNFVRGNPYLSKSLWLDDERDFFTIQSALESEPELQELEIHHGFVKQQPDHLKLLFQWIAAAPKLRSLKVDFGVKKEAAGTAAAVTVSPVEIARMIANALLESNNTTLESVHTFGKYFFKGKEQWNADLLPLLQFNRFRRLLRKEKRTSSSNSLGKQEQLEQDLALVAETSTKSAITNPHILYWLVRNHAGSLRSGCGGKRKRISE
jgi:hypothetical protein